MSFLARISARVTGPGTPERAVMPKGLDRSQKSAVVRRRAVDAEEEAGLQPPENMAEEPLTRMEGQEVEEENQLAAARRQEAEEDPSMATLRRQSEEQQDSVQTVRRQEEEEEQPVQALRRQAAEEEAEPIQTLLRQEEEEEEAPLQALRRQESEEDAESAIRPVRPVARQESVPLEDTGQTVPPPPKQSLEPDAGPVSQELAGEEEPSGLQALHRDLPSTSAPSPPPAAGAANAQVATPPIPETLTPDSSFLPQQMDGMTIPVAAPPPHGEGGRRPQVIIDQVDVLIHEPASSADRGASRRSRDRAMRARYLRRL